MKRTGFAPIIILLLIAGVLIVGGIWYYETHESSPGTVQDNPPTINTTTIDTIPATASPVIIAPTSSFPVAWDASSDMIVASMSGEITRDHYVTNYNLYDVRTGQEKLLIILSTSSVNIGPFQVIGGMLIFPAYENGKEAIYTLALDTGVLIKGNDTSPFDNLDFLAPNEFVYGQPVSSPPDTPMNELYDDIFLSKNGTTTKIGHLLSGGLYGSVMSNSSDRKYVFVSNQIYNFASGTWQPVPESCTGNRSAWLNNDVLVLRTLHGGGGAGPLCYYDLRTGITKTLGIAQAFAVVGDRIFYEPLWDNTASVASQIRVYDYDTGKDSLFAKDVALLSPYESASPVGRHWLIYQPVVMEQPQCMEVGCIGGVASGSPILFDFDTGSSSPITVDGTLVY